MNIGSAFAFLLLVSVPAFKDSIGGAAVAIVGIVVVDCTRRVDITRIVGVARVRSP